MDILILKKMLLKKWWSFLKKCILKLNFQYDGQLYANCSIYMNYKLYEYFLNSFVFSYLLVAYVRILLS